MNRMHSRTLAEDMAKEQDKLYGMSAIDGLWYVGTAEELEAIGADFRSNSPVIPASSPEEHKHTPGSWEAYYSAGAGWMVRKRDERPGYTGLAPICSMAWFQFDIPGIIDDDISAANARLIAAAPDLLVALTVLVDHAQETYPHFESERGQRDIAAALAAIKKAVQP